MSAKVNSTITDLEYDLLTVLHNLGEALKAYETYIQDAESICSGPCVELFKKLQEADVQHAQEVRHHLQEVMLKGKM